MLKNGPLLLAGTMAALLLGGCGKNDAENTDAAVTPPPRPTKPGVKPATSPTPANAATPGKPASGANAPGKPGQPTPNAGQAAQAGAGKPGQAAASKPGATGNVAKGANPPGRPSPAHPGMPAAPGVPGAPGQATAAGAPGKPPAPGAPAKPGAVGTQVASIPKQTGYDPFKITWHVVPPPPYIFGSVQPLRIASADVEVPPPGQISIREVANRRVSGIMSGDGVFAILESADGGDTEIVKPGTVTRDGYRVVAITADSVKLQRKDGNVIRTQVVPLTDASTTQQSNSGGLFGGRGQGAPGSGGFPGSGGSPNSGGFPGSGGRNGRPGGRRPGAAGPAGGGGGVGAAD